MPKIPTDEKRLSDAFVKTVKVHLENGYPKSKSYTDGRGLVLIVTATGAKLWRYNYSFKGVKEKYSIGLYPQISLKMARDKRLELERQKALGVNPIAEKRELKLQFKLEQEKKKEELENTVKKVCEAWLRLKKGDLKDTTLVKHSQRLIKDVYPLMGDKNIKEVTKGEIIAIVQRIQERGALESGFRVARLLNAIWRYALQLDKVEHNIIADIVFKDVLKSYKNENFRTITDKSRIGDLMNAIDNYGGEHPTRYLLKFLPHVFVRGSNIRLMEWQEVDFVAKCWTIPAHKMKMKIEHKMPLTDEAIRILKEIQPYTKDNLYVFSSPHNRHKPLSDSTINKAFKLMGFHDEIVAHGFRAMFSTIAYESGLFRGEVIESLLAHKDTNKVRASYNRANYETEKKEVVEWWSNYLIEAKNGN
jgi:integrase